MNGRLKRAAPIVAALPLFALAACSSGPSSGYVWAKVYTPAFVTWSPGYNAPETCEDIDNEEECSGGYYVPGHFLYWPDEWQLQLCVNKVPVTKGNNCGWSYVDEPTYDATAVGSYFGTRATADPHPSDSAAS